MNKQNEIAELEKQNFYFKRTYEHIHRVQRNMLYVVTECREELNLTLEDCRILSENVFRHDRTKFSNEQFQAYIDFSWHKKTGEPLTEEQSKAFDEAWKHHYIYENHHPIRINFFKDDPDDYYYHCNRLFTKHEAIEMVCDMQAMAQEFNEGVCRKFYEIVEKPKLKEYLPEDNRKEVENIIDETIKCFELRGW